MNSQQRVAERHARARKRRTEVDRLWTRVLVILRRLGRRRTLAVVTFGLLGLGGSSIIGIATGGPLPAIHDEFSYLLAADTFASGRLANPAPAHWEHFETYHVLLQPTYASKYPPAQGLVLALGQIITGSPAAGVWLSAGLMTAALAWMLLIWLPPQWAVLAAICCTVQLSWISYWGHSYWGGAVAAAGGALAFGAHRALAKRARPVLGLVLGVGLGILAMSRPYEGAIAGVCLAAALAVRVASAAPRERGRQLLPLIVSAGVVAITLAWQGFYDWRITGSVVTMPQQLYQSQYSANPLLPFGTPRKTPTYRHAEMERFFLEWGEVRGQRQQSAALIPAKIVRILVGLMGVGVVALFGLPGIVRRRSMWFVVVTISAVISATLLTAGSYPHYVAPVASLFYVAIGAALCHLHRKARQNRSANFAIVAVSVLILFTPFLLAQVVASPYSAFARNRAAVARQLESLPDSSLILVAYGPSHNVHEEWVYNHADIDAAKVVWARSMGPVRDQQLIAYFSDRRVWRLAPDTGLSLEPYSPHAIGRD